MEMVISWCRQLETPRFMPAMPHPLFQGPPPDQRIWRYTDLAKFISMLDQGSLYLSNLIALAESDPYEGQFPDSQVDVFATIREMPIPVMRRFLNVADDVDDSAVQQLADLNFHTVLNGEHRRNSVYVNCWHMNTTESDAMWRLYTLQGQGIAVQSTYERLVRSLHMTHQHVQIGIVGYHDYNNHHIRLDNVFYPALNKRSSFAHERELRLTALNNVRTYGRALAQTNSPANALRAADIADGFAIEVDLDLLIERVVISPRSPLWLVDMVASLLRRYGLPKPVAWSPLYTLSRAGPLRRS